MTSKIKGWVGVDLDGTLARHSEWSEDGGIGAPVPAMLARVKRWLEEGVDVRIMTARVGPSAHPPPHDAASQRRIIEDYCLLHVGKKLPVTATKDYDMVALYDDRAVHVIPNTGQVGLPAAYQQGPFICGQGGPVDHMGCPELLLVCPAPGLDGFAAYKLHTPYSAPGY